MVIHNAPRSLALAAVLMVAVVGLSCSTESPTAPRQNPSAPIQVPPPPAPDDAEVSFTCVAAPPGFDRAGWQTVSFTNTSTPHYLQFQWQFGDGATSRDEDPTHTYRITGQRSQYQARLTATAAFGSDTASLFVPSSCEGFDDGGDDGDAPPGDGEIGTPPEDGEGF